MLIFILTFVHITSRDKFLFFSGEQSLRHYEKFLNIIISTTRISWYDTRVKLNSYIFFLPFFILILVIFSYIPLLCLLKFFPSPNHSRDPFKLGNLCNFRAFFDFKRLFRLANRIVRRKKNRLLDLKTIRNRFFYKSLISAKENFLGPVFTLRSQIADLSWIHLVDNAIKYVHYNNHIGLLRSYCSRKALLKP